MKRFLLVFSLLVALAFSGCAAPSTDFFAAFRGGYVAEVEGTLYGMPFSARIEMGKTEEVPCVPATITFYAPEEISGTVIARAADGAITLTSGGVSTGDMGGVGAALFSLFPTSGSVRKTETTDEGRTRLTLEGVELEFLSDGTPYAVKTEDVTATVVRWST
ncbi:MAG: hypothetical protein IKM42_03410 [Clostridia bacterium]|nr:hypothetical protein [Clostridia bacterium]MBR3862688.1 hypothetical protein [Clostridia bacterium]